MMSNDQHLQNICAHALFNIRGSTDPTNKLKKASSDYDQGITQPDKSAPSKKTQVMISYQWDSQKMMIQLRNKLVKAGFRVWMDITHMREF